MTFPQLFRRLALACLFLFSALAFGQGIAYTGTPMALTRGGLPAAGATVTVCSGNVAVTLTASPPCSPYASIFSDPALSHPITQPGFTTDGLGNYPFFVAASGAYTIVLTGSGFTGYSTVWSAPVSVASNNTFTGPNTFATTNVKTLQNIRMADQFAGADCGAKINAADADLGSAAGEIWVDQACGTTISTSVTVGNGNGQLNGNYHILRFTQGGTWTISAIIHVSTIGSGIVCEPQALGGATGFKLGPVMLQQAGSNTNLAEVVSLDAGEDVFQNCIVDGNKANNTGTIGLLVNKANRVSLEGNTFQNNPSHGVEFLSTSTNEESCCAHMQKDMFANNNGDGIFSIGSSDVFLSNSEIENNGANGIELKDSPTWRISHVDIGGNGSAGGNCSSAGTAGICIYGTAAGAKSFAVMIWNTQFGNQYQNDIKAVCYDTVGGAATCGSIIIDSNEFFGTSNRTPNNTYNNITLVDGGSNVIVGNFFAPGNASHLAAYAISTSESASGRYASSQIAPNTYSTVAYGTTRFQDSTFNGMGGLEVPLCGGTGSNCTFKLFDVTTSASSPAWFFRVSGGNLQEFNNSFTLAFQHTSSGQFEMLSGPIIDEGSSPGGGISAKDVCYADSTAHAIKCSYNNGTFFQIPQVIVATSSAFATATTAGTCVQNTTAVTGATTAMTVSVSPVSTPGVGAVWSGFVSSAGNVTINECAVATSAGGTIAFNIRVTP